jgi:hypothetical protein
LIRSRRLGQVTEAIAFETEIKKSPSFLATKLLTILEFLLLADNFIF